MENQFKIIIKTLKHHLNAICSVKRLISFISAKICRFM